MEEIKIPTPYINIQTDFGFKHVFGSKKHKPALIKFLNILFGGKLTVTDVVYHDKEILPSEEDGKRIIYDVYCTSKHRRMDSPYFPERQIRDKKGKLESEHRFILEMQNIYVPPFEERLVYYASKMVAEQGKAGWKYELDPVFTVAVTNFNFSHLSRKLVRDVMLLDRESGEALVDKVHILLCSLEELPKEWEDCSTELEKVLFLIKNMETMNNTSLAYREGGFSEIFEAARSNTLKKEEMVAYSQSLEKLRDIQLGIDYAVEQAIEKIREKIHAEVRAEGEAKGRAEGRAEGLEEGRAEGEAKGELKKNLENARNFKLLGVDPAIIAKATGLSIAEINKL